MHFISCMNTSCILYAFHGCCQQFISFLYAQVIRLMHISCVLYAFNLLFRCMHDWYMYYIWSFGKISPAVSFFCLKLFTGSARFGGGLRRSAMRQRSFAKKTCMPKYVGGHWAATVMYIKEFMRRVGRAPHKVEKLTPDTTSWWKITNAQVPKTAAKLGWRNGRSAGPKTG